MNSSGVNRLLPDTAGGPGPQQSATRRPNPSWTRTTRQATRHRRQGTGGTTRVLGFPYVTECALDPSRPSRWHLDMMHRTTAMADGTSPSMAFRHTAT